MAGECMPRMVMPGCGRYGSPAGGGPPLLEWALILITALCVYVLVIFGWRFLRRSEIPGYSPISEFVGHDVHALAMIGMSLLTIGTLASIGPLIAYVLVFAALALFFLARLALRWGSGHRAPELGHAFTSASMAYMFSARDLVEVTVACLVLYSLLVLAELRRAGVESERRGRIRALQRLGTNGSVAIALSMMLMLALMQWPATFA